MPIDCSYSSYRLILSLSVDCCLIHHLNSIHNNPFELLREQAHDRSSCKESKHTAAKRASTRRSIRVAKTANTRIRFATSVSFDSEVPSSAAHARAQYTRIVFRFSEARENTSRIFKRTYIRTSLDFGVSTVSTRATHTRSSLDTTIRTHTQQYKCHHSVESISLFIDLTITSSEHLD